MSAFGTGWNGYTPRIRKSGLMVMRQDSPYMNKREGAPSQSTYPANGTNGTNGANKVLAARAAMPESGYLVGIGLEMSTKPSSGVTVGFNFGVFGADLLTANLPPTTILDPNAYGNNTISSAATGSSAQLLDILFGSQPWVQAGDPLWLIGLWSVLSGTLAASSQGGIATIQAHDPRASRGANSSYRGSVESNNTHAWTTGTVANLVSDVGAFPTNWTAVLNSGGTNANFAAFSCALYFDATY